MSRAWCAPPARGARPSRSPACTARDAAAGGWRAEAARRREARPGRCRCRIPQTPAQRQGRSALERDRRPWRRPLFAFPYDLDVEVLDVLGVRLNELLARLHVGTHQLFKRVVDSGDVINCHLKEDTALGVHGRFPQLFGVHLAETFHPRSLSPLADLAHRFVALSFGVTPDDLRVLTGSLEDFEERRLGHVEVALLDDLGEISEEEREQQRLDVAAVDVRICHGDDAVIANLLDVEVVADTGAHRGDEVTYLVRSEHFVEARLFHVEDLAAQRQDRLRAAVAAAPGGAPRPVTLDAVDGPQRRGSLSP